MNEYSRARRAVAIAKLSAFESECYRLGVLMRQGTLDRVEAADALTEIAFANNITESLGADNVQRIIAEAFTARDRSEQVEAAA